MNSVTVSIAGREYEVKPLQRKATKIWRQALGKPFDDIVGIIANKDNIMLDNPSDVAGLIVTIKDTLLYAPDFIFEALCAYAPAIDRDKEYIDENGYDEEIMKAFVEVLRIVYPFGVLAGQLTGFKARMTSMNGNSQNMAESTRTPSRR